jgi:hypothetical protein
MTNKTESESKAPNPQLDLASLPIVDLAKLRSNDGEETSKLVRASSRSGFFFLDLRNDPTGKELLKRLPKAYSLAQSYFDQTEDVKLKDARSDQRANLDRGSVKLKYCVILLLTWVIGLKRVSATKLSRSVLERNPAVPADISKSFHTMNCAVEQSSCQICFNRMSIFSPKHQPFAILLV